MNIKSPDFKRTAMTVFGTERNVFSVDVESTDIFGKQHYVVIACIVMKDKLNFGLAITHPKDKVDKSFGLRLAAERAIRKPYFSIKIKKIDWVDSSSIIKSTLGIERKRINSLFNNSLKESISDGTEVVNDASVSELSKEYNDTFTPDEWNDLLNAITMGCDYRNVKQTKQKDTDKTAKVFTNRAPISELKNIPNKTGLPKDEESDIYRKEIVDEDGNLVGRIYLLDGDDVDFFVDLGYFPF
jgi:hypothetical protein